MCHSDGFTAGWTRVTCTILFTHITVRLCTTRRGGGGEKVKWKKGGGGDKREELQSKREWELCCLTNREV